jgi:hypothetical protein
MGTTLKPRGAVTVRVTCDDGAFRTSPRRRIDTPELVAFRNGGVCRTWSGNWLKPDDCGCGLPTVDFVIAGDGETDDCRLSVSIVDCRFRVAAIDNHNPQSTIHNPQYNSNPQSSPY